MTSRYVRPDVKAKRRNYDNPECPLHVGNLSIYLLGVFLFVRAALPIYAMKFQTEALPGGGLSFAHERRILET